MLPKIISFSGKKHSGKTELCKVNEKYGYININFADELKKLVCNCLNISIKELEINKDKITNEKYILTPDNIHYISKETLIDINLIYDELYNKQFTSIRQILQFIGTDLIRKYSNNWHIDKIKNILKNNPNNYYTISDTRFLNEKKLIDEFNGECWYIIRENQSYDTHVSENELSSLDFNNIIYNNSNKNAFIIKWIKYIESKYI